jgi:L,D-transpeptidase catalytic domain
VTVAASGFEIESGSAPASKGPAADARKSWRLPWLAGGAASTSVTLLILFGIASRAYLYEPLEALDASPSAEATSTRVDGATAKEIQSLERKARHGRDSLAALVPGSVYIVVDTSQNRLYVKRRDKILLEAICSTGSGTLLKDPDTQREWLFETPRGRFRVIRKAEDPVWTKPDWAFVEEGKPVPGKWSERRDPNTLGDYALYLGDGYMIHGTLYQRYLGRSVTHGCVRLGDDDLERVYRMTPVGAPVFIF